mgnify:CR=1 FL=1
MDNNIKEIITNEINENEICLFMKGTPDAPQCGFSMTVVNILKLMDVNYKSINVLENQNIRDGIKEFSEWPTIPQLYIKKEFLGGCDIIKEMYENGELVKLFEDKTVKFQIGPNSNESLEIQAQHFSSVGLSRSGFLQGNILTSSSAQQNITQLDLAITVVSTYRGQIASTSAKMGYTIANLDQMSINLSSSNGRIEDADFALETSNLAKNQILQQAATAMLSQANASKASVLSLIAS